MATSHEKLAKSLGLLHARQNEHGAAAIRSSHLTRTHRERLVKSGFLQEVMKGWYVPSRPDEIKGESTAWYTSFWHFAASYLESRFSENWVLFPEQSLSIHAGNWTVPRQLAVRSPKGNNNVTQLPHGTSLFELKADLPAPADRMSVSGLRLYSLEAALIEVSPRYFRQQPTDARTALLTIRDASELLARLLDGGHTTIAGRLAGALRSCGRVALADEILTTMSAAGYAPRECNPFDGELAPVHSIRAASPYEYRIRVMWQAMRQPVIDVFPEAPGLPAIAAAYTRRVAAGYAADAYHSLSIEANEQKGYWQAFQAVGGSIGKVLHGAAPGTAAEQDHRAWYREMFAPSVFAGLLRPSDLAGYRTGPVFIRKSMHAPMNKDAVRDAMPVFFELLAAEQHPAVRVVLGHFIFVYIHPYTDGNGRMGRFLMNVMLAAGGYPWTVVPLAERDNYMAALEQASVDGNITPFAKFLATLVRGRLAGEPLPAIPHHVGHAG